MGGVIFLVSALLFYNCETEVLVLEPETTQISQLQKIAFDELPSNLLPDLERVEKLSQTLGAKNGGVEALIVDKSQILSLVDSLNVTRYSIKLRFQEQPENLLYNLILGIDQDHQPIAPFVLKYEIENIDEIRMESGLLDISRMKGMIYDYSLERFLNYSESYFEKSITSSDPCNQIPTESVVYGADGEVADDPNDNGGDEEPDCTYFWITVFAGDVVLTTFNWSCQDGTSGQVELRNTECDPGTATGGYGGAGVNQGDPAENDEEEDKIFNKLTNECAKDIFNELLLGLLNNRSTNPFLKPEVYVLNQNLNFNESILKMFNESSDINLVIRNSEFNPGGSNAQTVGTTITIYDSYLDKATQLSIARTMMHESLHAYINALYMQDSSLQNASFVEKINQYAEDNGYTPGTNLFHHNFMAQYIDAMAYSLYQWDQEWGTGGNLGWNYYKSMAFGGMFQTDPSTGQITDMTDSFKELEPSQIERQKIADIVVSETNNDNDAKGNECN